ncbi:MAG: Heat-inducible transcription repressor HrcA [Brockia lithotrophica]|uniref:Heat-inducible transcription repressor HrcA n=1 Tax=Brockia lithotrophica TaxID=933949 RepID=A0A2T5G4N0_9BACL|nr:MAG: Heat-inducible transcription repressor HrcA [Brockia lithotrophica]
MELLNERQEAILRAVVELHVRFAEPIGSRTIAKLAGIPLSPATIRNEMADLEEMGYLEQPHTSAGRIPSEKGYRYYVDHILPAVEEAFSVEEGVLERLLRLPYEEAERALREAAEVLAALTDYAVVALGPDVDEAKLYHLEVIPLEGNRVVAILVTEDGRVFHRTSLLPEGVPRDVVEDFVRTAARHLRGKDLRHVPPAIYAELAEALARNAEARERAAEFLRRIFDFPSTSPVHLEGTTRLLAHPEFRSVEAVREFLGLVEREELLRSLLEPPAPGIVVRIGGENEFREARRYAIVSAALVEGGTRLGTIGVIGPVRMEYGRVLALLNTLLGFFFDRGREVEVGEDRLRDGVSGGGLSSRGGEARRIPEGEGERREAEKVPRRSSAARETPGSESGAQRAR